MNKKLLFIVFVVSSYFLGAQSLEIYDDRDNLLTSEQEFIATGNVGDFLGLDFKVKNVSTNVIDVKVRKQHLELHGTSEFFFCWGGTCLSPYQFVSPNSVTIQPGEYASNPLSLDFESDESVGGISRVAVTAFDTDNPGDSARIVVIYDFATSVKHINKSAIKFYPNPTQGELNIKGGFGKTLAIYNAIGQHVFTTKINSDEELLDISFLKSGIYMAQLSENGKIIETRKLIKR